jgi:hypothetical protein
MMRDIAFASGVVLVVAAVVLVAAGTAGAAIGLFFGALLWAMEEVAGPFGPGAEDTGWWILGFLALVFGSEVAHAWIRTRVVRPAMACPRGPWPGGGDLTGRFLKEWNASSITSRRVAA